ncbi:MAG: rRNA synthase [Blastocatellia bacterium]|nr:rRNA synthase [Blastocatellia bacterium]
MKESLQFQIEPETAGQRLDEFLAARLGWLSRLRIAHLLDEGACFVNRMEARAGQQVRVGDRVEISLDESAPGAMTPEQLPLEIIYEDEDLLVLVKPAGMLTHPTRGVKSGTLANALAYHLNREATEEVVRPGIVHRLDRATSGLMVIAKNQRALSILSRHFHQRLVEKRYLALVEGIINADECDIEAPIGRGSERQPHWIVMADGKPALTRLRVLERRSGRTQVELEPVTGRTNQLRIHCAHLGHPIVGDEWYGSAQTAGRLCLHAARLSFHHPSGGKWLEFNSPLPAEVAALFKSEPQA